MKRTVSEGVLIWFWERYDPRVPTEITFDSVFLTPDEDEWGPPNARWTTEKCDFEQRFDRHEIIFDLTFCVGLLFMRMSNRLTWSLAG
jgi:hypothetical protein